MLVLCLSHQPVLYVACICMGLSPCNKLKACRRGKSFAFTWRRLTPSNFEIRCDATSGRLHTAREQPYKRTRFATIPCTTHTFYGFLPEIRVLMKVTSCLISKFDRFYKSFREMKHTIPRFLWVPAWSSVKEVLHGYFQDLSGCRVPS